MQHQKPSIYAIDFGTTNSLLSAANQETTFPPIPLDPYADDKTIMKSILYTSELDQWQFGQEAIQLYTNQNSDGRLLRSLKKFLPDESFAGTRILGKNMSLVDLIAEFLKHLRHKANKHFDTNVDRVILGRPAAFSLEERFDMLAQKRLEAAAKMAGFKEIHFCHEPIAAAYDYQKQMTQEVLILVVDLGGGTSDFSILKMNSDRIKPEDVLGIGGLSLAGDAYDGSIMKHKISKHFGANIKYKLPMGGNILEMPHHLISKLNSPADIGFLARREAHEFLQSAQKWSLSDQDKQQIDQLMNLADEGLGFSIYRHIEQSKKELSSHPKSSFFYEHVSGIRVKEDILQSEFDEFTRPITTKIINSLKDVMASAQVTPDDIDLICLTGGTAQLKTIKTELTDMFGANKIQGFQYFHSIIQGLAEKAKELCS